MPSKSFLRLHLLASACLFACLDAQAASGVPQSYDLPAQPLSASLLRIADEGGTPLSLDADLVRGLPAPAVRGQLTPEAALRRALAGTGLDLQRTGSGILTVRKAQAAERRCSGGRSQRPDAGHGHREGRVRRRSRDHRRHGTL